MKKLLSILALCLGAQRLTQAQSETVSSFDQSRIDITRKGMYGLGGWAVANLAYGATQVGRASPQDKAFHQMNMGWGAVNLALAGISLLTSRSAPKNRTPYEVLKKQQTFETVFLVNTALDVAYVAGGAYLNERGVTRQNDQQQGFGKSIMVQGAFLFLFDGLMYAVHRNHFKKNESLWKNIQPASQGLGVQVTF